ncbi:MAG: methionyl-tRNA formyltransferase [Clostridiales Family XIII bacterium]|jgi:methionyl-tRNA formyltransferase|nr:methionyl-tRNA formyltransferase [Clostridiales Family XIII bacterium]
MTEQASLRIVYMGTPDFACPALRALYEAGHEIVLVTSQPDRPSGRGKKEQPTPVKKLSLELGLPIEQPAQIRGNSEYEEYVKSLAPDLLVVAAYGKILPLELLRLPRLGCVNIHASLLPRYRGAAPIQRAIEAGDSVSGITLMYMAEALDAGDIILQETVDITGFTAGEATEVLSRIGADLLIRTLPAIADGSAGRVPQNHKDATYAPMIEKSEGRICFERRPEEIVRKILAMNPSPGAFVLLDGNPIKVRAAHVGEQKSTKDRSSGCVVSATDAGVAVQAMDGIVVFDVLQAPGKKALAAAEFLRGRRIMPGTIFENEGK